MWMFTHSVYISGVPFPPLTSLGLCTYVVLYELDINVRARVCPSHHQVNFASGVYAGVSRVCVCARVIILRVRMYMYMPHASHLDASQFNPKCIKPLLVKVPYASYVRVRRRRRSSGFYLGGAFYIAFLCVSSG